MRVDTGESEQPPAGVVVYRIGADGTLEGSWTTLSPS